jgi:type IX secretion system PorP/SprF family membrane protein
LFYVGLKKTVLILLLLTFSRFSGQDIHFSQYNGSLMNLNPALTGFFNGDYRVSAIFRSQWLSVPVPYRTISMSGESRTRIHSEKKDMAGMSILFNSDKAGDTHYRTTQLYGGGSYIYNGSTDSSLLVSLGANIGFCQVGFDYSRMTFDNQFDGLNYNAATATGENFQWTRYNYADINVGMAAQYILNKKQQFLLGLSLHHITSPKISYQGNDNSRLDPKFSTYARFITPVNLKTELVSELLYSRQGKYNELIPHASLNII